MTVSLIPGNTEVIAVGFQADNATPALTPVIAFALEDCQLDPNVGFITLAESDASSLEGDDVVVGATPGGTFKKYSRPSEDDALLYALLGKSVDSGVGTVSHTLTMDPASPFATPYLTIWDIWPGVACVRYDGCRIAQATFTSQADGSVESEYTVAAMKATMGVAAPILTGLIVDELAFTWPEFTATLGGVHEGIVNQWSLTVSRGTKPFKGDNGLSLLDIPNGLASVSGNMEVAFLNDQLYRAANTGTTGGTVLTPATFSEAILLDMLRASGYETKFSLNAAQIKNFKVGLKTDASPATATFDFKSKRDPTLSNFISAVVKNAAPHADRS